jgi:uncharacterized repeat protein (TIGR01451 family)
MKKATLSLFFVVLCFVCKAQTYSSTRIHVTVTDTVYHDSSSCMTFSDVNYNITVDTSFAGDSLSIVDTATGMLIGSASPFINASGSSPWTFAVAADRANIDANVTPGGGFVIFNYPISKVTTSLDTLRYINFKDSLFVHPCIYSTVSGNIYIDNNANCIFDSGDVEVHPIDIDLTTTYSSPHGISTTEIDPLMSYMPYSYRFQESWLTSYTVAVPSYLTFIFPFSPCFTAGSYTGSTLPLSGADFPLQCTSSIDVECYALSPEYLRLHRPFYLHPYVSNTGCDSASGTLTLVLDGRVTYDSSLSSLRPDTVRGDTLMWNYHNLTNVSSGAYWNYFMSQVYLTPDSTVAVGDTLCFRVYTNILPTDVNPTNNDYTVCLPVVYSYDPNAKSVAPAGSGPLGILAPGTDTLTYTINFQNTGTSYAETVVILDTLDSHLNPHSLRILGTSATMTPKWLASNIVQFEYDRIYLPDSATNEPASHGQVRFSIAMNAAIPPGTTIKNTGYIYFDGNPPIVTNTTNSTLPVSTGKNIIATETGMKIYPNPATDVLTIEGMNSGEIDVIGISGTVLIRKTVNGNETSLDVSHLASGIYLLRTINGSETNTFRFTKY